MRVVVRRGEPIPWDSVEEAGRGGAWDGEGAGPRRPLLPGLAQVYGYKSALKNIRRVDRAWARLWKLNPKMKIFPSP